ncbi:MAG TPA: glycosyltransferase, partial [Verrucomicrobiae bacterium]|nr:glycosyltransferase [Verrucomicrobiae bacterium]
MTRVKVAVVTRTKNRPLLLRRCVESVLNQTFQNWFHIIVNDGGDPTTVEGVISGYAGRYNNRVRIIHNESSVGMQNASNQAIRATDSEYIGIHDDDDTWHGMFLEECVGYLDAAESNSRDQGVATQSFWIMEEMDSWGNVIEISRQDFMPFESVNLFQAAAKNPFPPIAFLYRRQVHETIGYFDQAFNELGDHDFNLRFLTHYDIGTIRKRLAGYHWRHHATGSSYGNTVTDGVTSHRKMSVRMQNHYLRQDMANNRMGVGFLMNIASTMESQMEWIHGLHKKSDHAAGIMSKVVRKMQYYERIVDTLITPWKGRTLPRRIYDHVTDLFTKRPESIKMPEKNNGHTSAAELESKLKNARILSLDVFDTALLRLVRKPTDVFLYIQQDVRRLLNRPELGFVEARIAAEEESRQEMRRVRSIGETTLDDIYAVLRKRLGCDEKTASQIKQWELAAERHLCFANPHITRLVAQTRGGERRIVFCSDMYLPAREIAGLLEQNGFKDTSLFVSSELWATKHEGPLFDQVTTATKCQPSEMLHIGDNPHSDVARPREKGIVAHHWTRAKSETALVDQHTSISGAWEGDLASSLYAGLVRRHRLEHPVEKAEGEAFWKMIGYEIVGPLHHAYVSWVINRASKLGLKKLFFLARDGFNLLKTFDMFRKRDGLELEGEYLFASRRLWNFARIDRLDEENMVFLVVPNPMMRVRDFLARIDIDPEPHEALVRRMGFKGLNQRVTTEGGVFKSETHHQNMRRLIHHFGGEILSHAQRERETLAKYFKDVGLLEDGAGIVDVGWHASSSRSLQMLLAQSG